MKFLLFLIIPVCSFAQQHPEIKPAENLFYKAKVFADSGTIKGYYVSSTDSAVILSSTKKYITNTSITIPVNSIRKLQIRNQTGYNILSSAAITVVGFIVTAGLTKNGGDVDYDGKTSFWELLFTAIEGTTSGNRRRRNTALIVGAAGGTAFLVASFSINKKLTLNFPLTNRAKFYNEKKSELNKYTKF